MKVTLRKSEKMSGFIFKTKEYELFVQVSLTPEERVTIMQAGIDRLVLVEYSYHGEELNWEVGDVVYSSDKGTDSRFVAPDAIARDRMETQIRSQLAALKSQLDAFKVDTKRLDTFEL